MRSRNSLGFGLSLGLALGGCGGSDQSAGEDQEVSDTTADVAADTVVDVAADTVVDVAADTVVDVAADVASEVSEVIDDLGGNADTSPAQDAVGEAIETDAVDVDVSAAEALCWGTSGAWVGGACDCHQDAATTNLGFYFDAELGCIADPEKLCGQTGGIWENLACACAQDGVSLYYEFDRKQGCRFPDTTALATDLATLPLLETIARYAALEQSVWLVDRPGVFDVVARLDTPAALADYLDTHGWAAISHAAGACDAPLVSDAWPEVSCDSISGMTATGCFFRSVSDEYHHVSELMQLAVDYGFASWSPAEIAAMQAEEQAILEVFVSSEHGVTLAFRRRAGAWVLVVVDLSRYSCSA